MLLVLIILILGFGLFCAYSSEDLLSKTSLSVHAWLIALFMFVCCAVCVLMIHEGASKDALIKQEKKEIMLEKQIQVDTSYSIKTLK